MPGHPRRHLTYANVMSTLALFIALGGSAYAATQINGRDIADRSIPATKLATNTLTGREIRESKLGVVRRASRADRATTLEGYRAADLLVRCQAGTVFAAGVCFERTARAAAPYHGAWLECAGVGAGTRSGRLPSHAELAVAAIGDIDLSVGGELTSSVVPSLLPGRLDVIFVANRDGLIGTVADIEEAAKPFRCVTDPHNAHRAD